MAGARSGSASASIGSSAASAIGGGITAGRSSLGSSVRSVGSISRPSAPRMTTGGEGARIPLSPQDTKINTSFKSFAIPAKTLGVRSSSSELKLNQMFGPRMSGPSNFGVDKAPTVKVATAEQIKPVTIPNSARKSETALKINALFGPAIKGPTSFGIEQTPTVKFLNPQDTKPFEAFGENGSSNVNFSGALAERQVLSKVTENLNNNIKVTPVAVKKLDSQITSLAEARMDALFGERSVGLPSDRNTESAFKSVGLTSELAKKAGNQLTENIKAGIERAKGKTRPDASGTPARGRERFGVSRVAALSETGEQAQRVSELVKAATPLVEVTTLASPKPVEIKASGEVKIQTGSGQEKLNIQDLSGESVKAFATRLRSAGTQGEAAQRLSEAGTTLAKVASVSSNSPDVSSVAQTLAQTAQVLEQDAKTGSKPNIEADKKPEVSTQTKAFGLRSFGETGQFAAKLQEAFKALDQREQAGQPQAGSISGQEQVQRAINQVEQQSLALKIVAQLESGMQIATQTKQDEQVEKHTPQKKAIFKAIELIEAIKTVQKMQEAGMEVDQIEQTVGQNLSNKGIVSPDQSAELIQEILDKVVRAKAGQPLLPEEPSLPTIETIAEEDPNAQKARFDEAGMILNEVEVDEEGKVRGEDFARRFRYSPDKLSEIADGTDGSLDKFLLNMSQYGVFDSVEQLAQKSEQWLRDFIPVRLRTQLSTKPAGDQDIARVRSKDLFSLVQSIIAETRISFTGSQVA